VYGAACKLRDQLAVLAGKALEADPADLEFVEGGVRVRGVPERQVSLRQLAARAHVAPDSFGLGPDLGLQATYRWSWPTADHPDEQGLHNAANTYAVLVHAALVEVDAESGQVRVLKYVATEDCGRLLNPMIVRGQTMGGVVNGLGWALTESFVYDEHGQLLTGTFMDYLLPRFADVPPLEIAHVECPTPFGPLGAKGMGEGGAIPPPACIANAVEDAIAHLGGKIRDSHLAPATVLRAIREGRQQAGRETAGDGVFHQTRSEGG
jgi:CO/xanthine dehydrogenase Mo-binding subunit